MISLITAISPFQIDTVPFPVKMYLPVEISCPTKKVPVVRLTDLSPEVFLNEVSVEVSGRTVVVSGEE